MNIGILEKGIRKYNKGNYQKAIEILNKVEKKDRNFEARQLLYPHKTAGLKCFATYCMTWLPYHWFKKLQKWRGVPHPT